MEPQPPRAELETAEITRDVILQLAGEVDDAKGVVRGAMTDYRTKQQLLVDAFRVLPQAVWSELSQEERNRIQRGFPSTITTEDYF
jgi:hypothetical protein